MVLLLVTKLSVIPLMYDFDGAFIFVASLSRATGNLIKEEIYNSC